MATQILIGDAAATLATLPDASVHCCVTSPPYFGLRDYGVAGQIGLEKTVEEYVAKMVGVFREVRRVLRDDGTLWLNLGDSYAGSGPSGATYQSETTRRRASAKSDGAFCISATLADRGLTYAEKKPIPPPGLKHKDLIGIPWRVAFALQQDGWYLRQDIIWHKPNPMPESVRDRCTKSHEYMFLFAKKPRYFYDAVAIHEPLTESSIARAGRKRRLIERTGLGTVGKQIADGIDPTHAYAGLAIGRNGKTGYDLDSGLRNRRSVWKISTRSYKGAHFAVFPPDLIEPCIKAGTSEFGCCAECGTPFKRVVAKTRVPTRPGTDSTKSPDPHRHVTTTTTTGSEPGCQCQDTGRVNAVVLDPFGGSGTTAQVAESLGRNAILIELNEAYRPLIEARLRGVGC